MPHYGISLNDATVKTRGRTVTTTFHVAGGEIDVHLLDQLTDVTLTHVGGDTYQLTVQGETLDQRAVRNAQVYNALMRFYEGNRRPLDQLIQQDAQH